MAKGGDETRAWRLGGASYVAARRLGDATDAVARKLEAVHREVPGAPLPSEPEFQAVRDRYLENEALAKTSDSHWRVARNEHQGEIFRSVLLLAYRLVVFAAACSVLYHFA